jgi:hypothetical protein
VRLSADLLAALHDEANRRGVPVAEIVRDHLARSVTAPRG